MAKVCAPDRGMGDHGIHKLIHKDLHLVVVETQPSHSNHVTENHCPAPRAQFMADFVSNIGRIVSAMPKQAEADPVTGRFEYGLRAFQRLEPEFTIDTAQRREVTRGGGLRIQMLLARMVHGFREISRWVSIIAQRSDFLVTDSKSVLRTLVRASRLPLVPPVLPRVLKCDHIRHPKPNHSGSNTMGRKDSLRFVADDG